jgi:NitT/TauT family transport system substrate-binding protein
MKITFDKLKTKVLRVSAIAIAGVLFSAVLPVRGVLAEPVRVGVYRGIHSALVYVADSQGFFKSRGVDVVMEEHEAGILAVNDLIAGRVDVATASDFVFALRSFKHPDLRIPATICVGSDHGLVVRKDRGITRPQDLKGKRVAVTRGSSTEFFLYNYLIFNRIPAGSVHVVDQTPSEMVKAMADGAIDAALWLPPYTTMMEKQLGAKGAHWPAQSGQDYYFALFTKEAFLKKQPKEMEQFIAALSDAEAFIAKYPDRAQSVLQSSLKVDRETFLATWSRLLFRLQLTQDLIVLMEREAKWAIRNKLVESKTMPNYLQLFYFQALDKVKPEAVRIIH